MTVTEPTGRQVHADQRLTDLSFSLAQDSNEFNARNAVPSYPSNRRSDKYVVYDPSFWNRNEVKEVAPGDYVPQAGFRVSDESYYAKFYGVGTPVSDEDDADSDDVLSLQDDATRFVTHQVLQHQEKRTVSTMLAAGVWGADVASGDLSNGKWSAAGGTPLNDIDSASNTIRQNGGIRPNRAMMGRAVFDTARRNPQITALVSGGATTGSPAIVTEQLLATAFGLEGIDVVDSTENTANEGQTASNSFMTTDGLLLYYRPAGQVIGRGVKSAATRFDWTGLLGVNAAGVRIYRYRSDERRSEIVEGHAAFDIRITGKDLGVYFTDLV